MKDEILHEMVGSHYDEVAELKKELLKQSAEIIRLSGLLYDAPRSCRTCKYERTSMAGLPCATCHEHDMWILKEKL
jgi:hypothetical protein